jgi:hypothetical protein
MAALSTPRAGGELNSEPPNPPPTGEKELRPQGGGRSIGFLSHQVSSKNGGYPTPTRARSLLPPGGIATIK